MAASAIISDGTTDIELVYNAASQDDYKLRYGMRTGGSEPRPLWHTPDNAPPKLVRLTNDNQVAFLTMIAYGDDRDDLLNNIITLKRWVDGADQQAARYHNEGDVAEIYLRLQLDSATNYTDWSIIYGNVDDSSAHASAVAENNTLANNIVIMLVLEPLGTGAAITLRNDLASSPFMQEDSNGDGLCDGLNLVDTPTTSIPTAAANYLFGGQSQLIGVDASTQQGVYTDNVTASTSTDAVAKIIISGPTSSADPIVLTLRDGSANVIDTLTFDPVTPVDYTKTYEGVGRTWYEYRLSGTNSTAANFRIQMVRLSAGAANATNYLIQALYLEINQTVPPDAWCSTSAIENRYDPDSSNEGQINHVDVWGVPGDADAYLNTKITGTTIASGPFYHFYISRISDGKTLAADHTYLLDSADLTGGSDTGTGRIGTTYKRQSITTGNTGTVSYIITDPDVALRFSRTKWRAFMVCQRDGSASNTVDYFTVQETFHDGNPKEQLKIASEWAWVDLGLLSIPKIYDEGTGGGTVSITLFSATITNNSGGTRNFDCDAVFLFPVIDEFIIQRSNEFLATDVVSILPRQEATIVEDLREEEYHLGTLWNIPAGNKMTRLSFGASDLELQGGATVADQAHRFDLWNITLVITPRSRHLLGTT